MPSDAEERVGADAEEADADDLAVLLLGDDARLAHQLRLVLEDLVDDAAIDVELGGADLLDALRDVAGSSGARPAGGGARRRRRGAAAAAPATSRRLEHLRLAELRCRSSATRGPSR